MNLAKAVAFLLGSVTALIQTSEVTTAEPKLISDLALMSHSYWHTWDDAATEDEVTFYQKWVVEFAYSDWAFLDDNDQDVIF